MELSQGKLTSNEWGALEIKVNPKELRILNLIRDGDIQFETIIKELNYGKS